MSAHDRMLDPPDDDEGDFIELDEPQGDYERDTDAFMEGDWGSDERDRLLEVTYDR
jgi:hypothetical protein